MKEILDAILSGYTNELSSIPVPESYKGVVVYKSETRIFDGIPAEDRDPRKTLHIHEVPTPEPGFGEALIAVMASSINYNTVWSSIFEPIPTFEFLQRTAVMSTSGVSHDLPFHVVGSDLSGVILRVGPGVDIWQPGHSVVAHCLSVDLMRHEGHNDSMLDPYQRIWGYETNYGGLGEIALVKANQLMPKPSHLAWEEAACTSLVNSTAYRQLVSRNGADMKQGDIILIWGAAGGLGSFATQLALNGGAIPVCIVSSPEKARLCREMGATHVIDRHADMYKFQTGNSSHDRREWKRLGSAIRNMTGGADPDIVFEHTGRDTFAASVFTARKGGIVVTCASTSGYMHEYDNRYLWMNLKKIIGTHFANYREAWEANSLVSRGAIHPTLSSIFPLEEAGEATRLVQKNAHCGKVGVLCLSPREGLGVKDYAKRSLHEKDINRFRRHTAST